MPASGPSFSPYPFEHLPRITRADAAFASVVARWVAAQATRFAKLEALVEGKVSVRVVGSSGGAALVGSSSGERGTSSPPSSGDRANVVRVDVDPHAATTPGSRRAMAGVNDPQVRNAGLPSSTGSASDPRRTGDSSRGRTIPIDANAALAEVRIGGESIVLAAPSRPVRALAQAWLGGPGELDAPRPLTAVETSIWCLVVAAAIADLGIAADVWPMLDEDAPAGRRVELAVSLGGLAMSVVAIVSPSLPLRAAPPRDPPRWTFDVPIIVARAAVSRAAVGGLGVRDIVTVERGLELEIGDGVVRLSAAPGAVEARVASEYVRRDMAMPDDAHLELTVQLGTTRMSLRQLSELAVGQVIPFGRPLAGPFEVRAGGRVVGQGELIDIDGELGVRIVSLAPE